MEKNRQFNIVLKQSQSTNLKKLKLDTLLMIIHHLLKEYNTKDFINKSNELIVGIKQEELDFIEKHICSLHKYLDNNIITTQTLFEIFKNKNQSVLMKQIASNLEPMKVYYTYLTNLFSTKLSSGSQWIPELFAFSLLYSYKKEYGKSLSTYPFLEDFPFEKIIDIYNKNNLEIKKKLCKRDNINVWKVKTLLDEMYSSSEFLTKKYIQYNFKINEKRVSKTRNKKRKSK
ncbi:hypothetical protein [Poseidonibacter lekithochrous]|uniref:hypothetical protein n=1 Tax=Poseidonibacter lekithochrous TaxID=1904463 RepID=UPI0008FC9120|nr:hypothetical protein [Poseidonibacter lekithochrous]QKJ21904.1 hypothetical protein ALEK_0601 [Poseidonibacter lekithochrous]